MRPLRVLWLTKGLGLGGAERLLTLSASNLDADRFDVDVGYLLPWKDGFVPDLRSDGLEIVCYGAERTVEMGWPRRLASHLREGGYDIVHTHSPVPAVVARAATIGSTTRLIHTEHNVWDRYLPPTRWANTATYSRNDAVIAVSDGVAGSIRRPPFVPRSQWPKVETLHHGIEVDGVPRGPTARRRARDLLGIDAERSVIGTVANFTPKKNHAGLIAAVDVLRREIDDLLLVLVGSGPLEEDIRADVRRRGMGEHVRFLGTRDDVKELLPAFDLFALSSEFEGLAIALLEAMAAGVPCVATRVGGIPEAVRDGRDGLLVTPGDPRALAQAVHRLLTDDPLRAAMATSGIAHVEEHFSIQRAVRRIEEIYDEVMADR